MNVALGLPLTRTRQRAIRPQVRQRVSPGSLPNPRSVLSTLRPSIASFRFSTSSFVKSTATMCAENNLIRQLRSNNAKFWRVALNFLAPCCDHRSDNTADSSRPKKSAIYTKTGDSGTSSLFSGERRKKSDPTFEALGTVDELNAHIGVAYEHCLQANNNLSHYFPEIQSRLLDVGSHIATPRTSGSETKLAKTEFSVENLKKLELWIDTLDAQLPPLRNFILPSGGFSSAHLHVARAVCRRAERSLVPLLDEEAIDSHVYKYVNRLSDFFFVCARFAAMKEGKAEVVYKKEQLPPPQ